MRIIDKNTNSKQQTFLKLLFFIALAFTINVQAQVTVGSGISPVAGALLDLKQMDNNDGGVTADKGMKLPRVQLVSTQSLVPLTTDDPTQKAIHKGIVVYNIKGGTSTMDEGLYFWDGTQWLKTSNDIPVSPNSVQVMNLSSNIESASGTSSGTGGIALTFPNLIVPEDGAYAFSFRFYGGITGLPNTNPTRTIFYISVWVGATLIDIAEMNIVLIGNINTTYSMMLAGQFSKNDNVTFKISHGTGTYKWTLSNGNGNSAAANRTSMIWWRL